MCLPIEFWDAVRIGAGFALGGTITYFGASIVGGALVGLLKGLWS